MSTPQTYHVDIQTTINKVFASDEFENLFGNDYNEVFPQSYTGKIKSNNIRVSMFQDNYEAFYKQGIVSGTIVCSIFNYEMKKINETADKLHQLLVYKQLSGNLQTANGLLKIIGNDPKEPRLLRADFEVTFKYTATFA